jgi:hypothetical protein
MAADFARTARSCVGLIGTTEERNYAILWLERRSGVRLRYTSPALFWTTSALILILVGFGIANLTGIGYPAGDENWRMFVGVFSLVNAQFLLAGLLVVSWRSRLGTALLALGGLVAFMTFAPIPGVFQLHALAVIFLAIRRARRVSQTRGVAAV